MRTIAWTLLAVLICHQTAAAYWPTTTVTRESAARDKLPLSVKVTDLGDGSVEVAYEVTRTRMCAHVRKASVVAWEDKKLLLEVPVSHEADPGTEANGPGVVRGKLRVAKEFLEKCRLILECPVEPLNLGGQTLVVELGTFIP